MNDDELGMIWWNHITERQRGDALRAADTAVPAEAWQYWRETTAREPSTVSDEPT